MDSKTVTLAAALMIGLLYLFATFMVVLSAIRALLHYRFAEMVCYIIATIGMAFFGTAVAIWFLR